MVKVKKFLVTAAICLVLIGAAGGLLSLGGCDETSSQRIASVQAAVQQTQALSGTVDATIADVKTTINNLEASLADPNIPPEMRPQIVAALDKARAKLDLLIAQKQKLDTVLAQASAVLQAVDVNNANVGTEIQVVGQIMTTAASQVPAPYSGYVYLGGILLAGLGGAVGRYVTASQKNKVLDTYKTAITNVVTSVKTLLDPTENDGVIPADKTQAAIDVLKENQLPVTRQMVDDILDPMKNTGPVKVAA